MENFEDLITGVRAIMPELKYQWNEVQLKEGALRWFRKPFHEVLNDVHPSQRSVEISKQFNIPFNGLFIDLLRARGVNIREEMSDGYDCVYNDIHLIEDKNSFSNDITNNVWVGSDSGGQKVDLHLLKRFYVNEFCEITHAHISLANLSKTESKWKSTGGVRSILKFTKNDLCGITPIVGGWNSKRVRIFPLYEQL